MFKCKSCKDTGMVTLLSFSKPCLDCPSPFSPSLPDKEIWAECNSCGEKVRVPPETWGYELLRDEGCCRAKCTCGSGRTFTRIQK
jgi:hypothetical protein